MQGLNGGLDVPRVVPHTIWPCTRHNPMYSTFWSAPVSWWWWIIGNIQVLPYSWRKILYYTTTLLYYTVFHTTVYKIGLLVRVRIICIRIHRKVYSFLSNSQISLSSTTSLHNSESHKYAENLLSFRTNMASSHWLALGFMYIHADWWAQVCGWPTHRADLRKASAHNTVFFINV